MQVITGYLLDRAGPVSGTYPPEAFKAAFLACLLVHHDQVSPRRDNRGVTFSGFQKPLKSQPIVLFNASTGQVDLAELYLGMKITAVSGPLIESGRLGWVFRPYDVRFHIHAAAVKTPSRLMTEKSPSRAATSAHCSYQ